MNLSITEFRKKIREALNAAEAGELVTIVRHDKTFILLTMSNYNEAIVDAAKDGISRVVTDEVSSNIRPDINHIRKDEKKVHNADYVMPPEKNKSLDPTDQKPMNADDVMGGL